MQITYKKTDELIPYDKNPRFNGEAVEAVANSIREFGFKVPIILTTDNTIVTGHTRLKAAKRLGLVEVPCIIADDLSEAQIKAFRLADNRVGELAEWDFELLELELEELSCMNFNVNEDFLNFELFNEGVDEEEDLIEPVEEELGPYDKIHFLLTVENKDLYKIENKIKEMEGINGLEIKQSRYRNRQ